ncbi:hypothetical protein ACVWZK_009202 [Bradyrhizobium sp. GM0.4]|jgi:hypothetical protein
MKHVGNCFCGAVTIEVTGAPEAMGYCHCSSCRSWSGGPVNAFSLWKPEAVRISEGAENVETFAKTPLSQRKYCKKCGGHLMTNHPPLGLIDVFTATIPTLAFCTRRPRQLRRDGAANARRTAQAQGFPGRIRRQRRDDAGVAAPFSSPASGRREISYLIPARRNPSR